MAEQRRFGIVVGVSEFDPNEHMSSIPYATNDAVRIYETLRDICGFDTERLYLLTSSTPDSFEGTTEAPTRPNILHKLQYVADNASADDLILVFIASHGVEISNTPYFLTSDSRMNVIDGTAINANEINTTLESSRAKCVIRLFDACRSSFGVARSSAGRMTDGFQETMFASAEGWATISSCSSGEYSYDTAEFEQGVFSYYLCEGINGKAANKEGNVTLDGLVEYVKISLSNWSDRQTLKQTPHYKTDLSGILVLSSPNLPEEAPPPPLTRTHPLAELQAGIRGELATAAPDTRHFQSVSEEDAEKWEDNVSRSIERLIADFSDPSISISVDAGEAIPLQKKNLAAWRLFVPDTERLGVRNELVRSVCTTNITFASSEVIVPSSTMLIVCAQFNFFYWLWYLHACSIPTQHNRFKPSPPHCLGFVTLTPRAALDSNKVEAAVHEVLSRCSEAIVSWTQQLHGFVDTRLNSLRQQTTIIE